MKKLIISLATILGVAYNSQAICTYQKQLEGQEFPIGVMLTWSTSLEENTATFMIEKSENGLDFTNIGTTQSAGNSKKVKEYNFLDVMANTQFVHYRLKQIDIDGSFSYTDVLKVKKTITNNFMIARMSSPNTSKDFTATVDAFKDGNLRYEIRDLENNILFSSLMPVQNGLNEVSVSLTDLKPNTYKFCLAMDNEEESIILQKTLDEVENAKVPVANGQTGSNGKH
jgi:hypothetical protein